MPADVMTLVHFSVSACQNLAKSAGEPSFGFALNLARLASTSGDRRNSLIDVLSLSMTWVECRSEQRLRPRRLPAGLEIRSRSSLGRQVGSHYAPHPQQRAPLIFRFEYAAGTAQPYQRTSALARRANP